MKKETKKIKLGKLNYINIPINRQKIMYKAEKIYNIVTKESKSKMSRFYKDLSCDFKLLEKKCIEYKSEIE